MKLISNPQAEKNLLGTLILEPSKIFSLELEPNDFYDSRHKRLYEIILSLFAENKQPDLLLITSEHDRKYPGESIASYAASLTDDLFSIDMKQTAFLIKEAARQRKLQMLLHKTLSNKWDSAEAILENLQVEILKHQAPEKKKSKIEQVAFRLHDQINLNKKRGKVGERTGFRFLDKTIEGFIKTHFWTVGAYTSVGKTAFMTQLIVNALKENNMLRVAIFSTEMSDEGLLLRLVANRTGIPTMAILKGDSIPEVQKRIDDAFDYFHTKDVWIHDDVYTFEKIFLRCKQIQMTVGLDVVFVDYLQNMQAAGTIYERMSSLPVQLQKMAKDLDICVVGMSQISNEAAHGDSKVIGFKGAGEIAAACDLGIWLERDSEDNAKLICSIRKNRHGMTGKKELRFINQFTHIEE